MKYLFLLILLTGCQTINSNNCPSSSPKDYKCELYILPYAIYWKF